jgi:hypothetical protein
MVACWTFCAAGVALEHPSSEASWDHFVRMYKVTAALFTKHGFR